MRTLTKLKLGLLIMNIKYANGKYNVIQMYYIQQKVKVSTL